MILLLLFAHLIEVLELVLEDGGFVTIRVEAKFELGVLAQSAADAPNLDLAMSLCLIV